MFAILRFEFFAPRRSLSNALAEAARRAQRRIDYSVSRH